MPSDVIAVTRAIPYLTDIPLIRQLVYSWVQPPSRVPDLDYPHERPPLTFVDLESSPPCAGVGGGVAHYQRLALTLADLGASLAFVARSSFARDCLAPKFPDEQIISYDVSSPVDPSTALRGALMGRRLRPSAVIATTIFLNTFAFSLGLSAASGARLIVMGHHRPRLRARMRLTGAFGAAAFAFYAPARFSNLLGARVVYGKSPLSPGLPNELDIAWYWDNVDPQGLCSAIPPAPERDIDVCFLGRLSYLKGFHEFALVTGRLRARMPLLRIVAMGSPQLRAPPWVEHLGVVTEREKYNALSRCKVFLFPSHEEGFGIAVAEAMACGAIPVIWDLPEYPFRSAVRVAEWDLGGMERAVEELLADEALRASLSEAAIREAIGAMKDRRGLLLEALQILSIAGIAIR